MTYYDEISRGYDELHKQEQLNKLKIINSNIKIHKSSKLLDVGCGSGVSSNFKCFAVGIDPSMELLKLNKNKMKILEIAEALPFKDRSFDYVICITAMHNFSDIKKSKRFDKIRSIINEDLKLDDVIEEDKDVIFFCKRQC